MYFWIIFIFYLFTIIENTTATCSIDVKNVDSKSPIFLKNNTILHTTNENNTIILTENEHFELLCSGPKNSFANDLKLLNITCFEGRFLLPSTAPISIQIKCKSPPQAQVREIGVCNQVNKRIQIGFQVNQTRFLPKIELCFDHVTQTTFWTRHELHPVAPFFCNNTNYNFKRTGFEEVNPDAFYPKYSMYDKGHLTPRCDFYTLSEQRMTFFYINTAPQNGKFNRANWKSLEGEIRNAAKHHNDTFYIYTGTTNTIEEMARAKLPISRFFWKVVISKTSGNGIAFVGVNSDSSDKVANPCPDRSVTNLCDSLEWLSTSFKKNTKVDTKGRIFCCTIPNFRRIHNLKVPPFSEYRGTFLTHF